MIIQNALKLEIHYDVLIEFLLNVVVSFGSLYDL